MFRRNAPLPNQIVTAPARAPRTISLSDSKMVHAVFAFVAVAGLALAHVTLQFVTLDLKVQHRQLQERTRALKQEEQQLQTSIRASVDDSRVRESALSALNLREATPGSRVMASLPDELVARYTPKNGEAAGESPSGLPNTASRERTVASTLASFVDIGVATAAPVWGK